MNYYKRNIKHNKGDTYALSFEIENLGQLLDSAYLTCRDNLNDDNSNILFECSLKDGISIVEQDEELNDIKYVVRVSPEKTKDLQSGTYYYDLQIEVNGDVFTIMKGSFVIEQDVSRR